MEKELFKFKNNNINLTINKLDSKLLKECNSNSTNFKKNIKLDKDKHLTNDINSIIKDISMDLVLFIINECGYSTSDKLYKKQLLECVNNFIDSKTL